MSASDAYEESESESELEGRFQGSATLWKRHTAEERALATSLEYHDSIDLSLHLYNAHAVKALQYNEEAVGRARPWEGKELWFNRDDSQWRPTPDWTAWPLDTADVPRVNENPGALEYAVNNGASTFRRSGLWQPSIDLEDEMLGLLLKRAKERITEDTTISSSIEVKQRGSGDSTGGQLHQPLDSESSNTASADLDNSTSLPAQPNVTTDEDEARRVLLPSVRHILTELDSLFTALHKSRKGQMTSTRSRARSTSASQYTHSSRAPSEVNSSDSSSDRESLNNTGKRPGKGVHNVERSRVPHPRDWSEILGLAAMTGWDSEVIQKATQRCASLFGESMNFRTLPDALCSRSQPTGEDVSQLETKPSSKSLKDLDKPTETNLFCPFDDCRQKERSFPSVQRINEHFRRKHNWTIADCLEWQTRRRESVQAIAKHTETDRKGPRLDTVLDDLLQSATIDYEALKRRRKGFP